MMCGIVSDRQSAANNSAPASEQAPSNVKAAIPQQLQQLLSEVSQNVKAPAASKRYGMQAPAIARLSAEQFV